MIQGDNPEASKSKRQQRQLHQPERNRGNRSAEVAKIRAQQRQEHGAKQVKLAFSFLMVSVLMAAGNIGSIEQLENVRLREAGILLGRKRIPCRPEVREWLYSAARQRLARFLLEDFFRCQMRAGLVGRWLWFCDISMIATHSIIIPVLNWLEAI